MRGNATSRIASDASARPRPFLAPLLAAALLTATLLPAGCAAPPEPLVAVNLAVLARSVKPLRAEPTPRPAPPAPLSAETKALPALPARTIPAPKGLSPAEIRAKLDAQNELARVALADRLVEVYAAEVKKAEYDRLREIEEARLVGAGGVASRIRARFDAYDAERRPLVARLAFLAGYPDSNSVLAPTVYPGTKIAERRAAEAKELKARIAALDAAFDAGVQAERDAAERALAERLAALNEDLKRMRADVDARAAREAAAQLRRLNANLALQLNGGPITLPAVPARSVRLPATAPLPGVPSIPATPPPDPLPRLKAELRIWSGLRRVRVVPPGPGVRDATEEFAQWRRAHRSPPNP